MCLEAGRRCPTRSLKHCSSTDSDVRRAAVGVLGGRPALPDAVLEAVVARLEDTDSDVRRQAVSALRGRPALR